MLKVFIFLCVYVKKYCIFVKHKQTINLKIIKMSTEEKLDVISMKLFNVLYKSLVNRNNYQKEKANIVFKQYLKENAI